MTNELTHRRQSETLSNDIMLFAEEGNEHYGDHIWTLGTELPKACESEELIAFATEFYGVDSDEAEDLVNPDNIVDTAGAWDDREFVSELWQNMEAGDIKEVAGYRTFDGAVVINCESVQMSYSKED